MRITVLGKSPSWQDAGGACSGYLVQEGDTSALLDCGNGVFSKLRVYADYVDVDAVVLSHLHADHFLDLVPFAYALTYAPRQQPLPVDRWPGTDAPRPPQAARARGREGDLPPRGRGVGQRGPDRERLRPARVPAARRSRSGRCACASARCPISCTRARWSSPPTAGAGASPSAPTARPGRRSSSSPPTPTCSSWRPRSPGPSAPASADTSPPARRVSTDGSPTPGAWCSRTSPTSWTRDGRRPRPSGRRRSRRRGRGGRRLRGVAGSQARGRCAPDTGLMRPVSAPEAGRGVRLFTDREHVRRRVVELPRLGGRRADAHGPGVGGRARRPARRPDLPRARLPARRAGGLAGRAAGPRRVALHRARTPWLPGDPRRPTRWSRTSSRVVRLSDGAVVGQEALMRAEAAGASCSADEIVAAPRRPRPADGLRRPRAQRGDRAGVPAAPRGQTLFVNFTPTAIYDPDVGLRTTWAAARRAGADLGRVCFEVVETDAFPDLELLRAIRRHRLRERGRARRPRRPRRRAIGSLLYLDVLRPDVVKLDRGLVAGDRPRRRAAADGRRPRRPRPRARRGGRGRGRGDGRRAAGGPRARSRLRAGVLPGAARPPARSAVGRGRLSRASRGLAEGRGQRARPSPGSTLGPRCPATAISSQISSACAGRWTRSSATSSSARG